MTHLGMQIGNITLHVRGFYADYNESESNMQIEFPPNQDTYVFNLSDYQIQAVPRIAIDDFSGIAPPSYQREMMKIARMVYSKLPSDRPIIVLSMCTAGQQRSAALAACLIRLLTRCDLDQAIERVKGIRLVAFKDHITYLHAIRDILDD